MINRDLLIYIENEIARGTPKNIIQSNLLSNGWNEKDVAEGFSGIVVKNYNPVVAPSPAEINVNQQNVAQSVSSPYIKINLQNTSEPTISQPVILQTMLAQKDFQAMSASQTEPKKSHLTVIVITILVILIALGGGGFVYYKYLAPSLHVSVTQNSLNQISTTTQTPHVLSTQIDSTTSDIIKSLFSANDLFATLLKDNKMVSYEIASTTIYNYEKYINQGIENIKNISDTNISNKLLYLVWNYTYNAMSDIGSLFSPANSFDEATKKIIQDEYSLLTNRTKEYMAYENSFSDIIKKQNDNIINLVTNNKTGDNIVVMPINLNEKSIYFFSVDVLSNKTLITDTLDVFFNNELIYRQSLSKISSSTTISGGFYSKKKQNGNLSFVYNTLFPIGSLGFGNPKMLKEVAVPEDISCYADPDFNKTVGKVYRREQIKFTLQDSQYKWVTSNEGEGSVVFDQGEAILNTSKGKGAILTTQMALPIDTLYFELEVKGTNVSSNDQFNVYWDDEPLVIFSGDVLSNDYLKFSPTDLHGHAGTSGALTFVFIGNNSNASVNIKNLNISYGIGTVACVGMSPVVFTPVQ